MDTAKPEKVYVKRGKPVTGKKLRRLLNKRRARNARREKARRETAAAAK